MKLPNPKKLTDSDLWWVLQNILNEKSGCPIELKEWYNKVEKEFSQKEMNSRDNMKRLEYLKNEIKKVSYYYAHFYLSINFWAIS